MKVDTFFDIGQEVITIVEDEIKKGFIEKIAIEIDERKIPHYTFTITTRYYLRNTNNFEVERKLHQIYSSAEDMIKRLNKK